MTTLMQMHEGIGAAEFAERRRRVEDATAQAGFDALVAFTATNLLGPSAYLTGYEPRFGPREVALVVLVPGGRATLITYGYWDEIAPLPWIDEQIVKPDLDAIGRMLAERIPEHAARVGIAGYPLLPAKFAAAIASARPNARLEDATTFLLSQAVIKSAAEVEILRQTAGMTDAGVEAFLAGASEGAEETEIALAVEAAMSRAGADRQSFPPLIFSGPRVETGIGFPQRRRLVAGEQVNIVCGALSRGYKMDIGRVTSVGASSTAARTIMDTAAEMLDAMLAVVRDGAPVVAVPDAAARVVRERGMTDWIYRFGAPGYAGHGIGCWLDEPPRLRTGEEESLAAGMVLVLEARLGREGGGGATITEPVVVTKSGAERLSRVPLRTW
jgi:Xaa-Pro aminopeptidase